MEHITTSASGERLVTYVKFVLSHKRRMLVQRDGVKMMQMWWRLWHGGVKGVSEQHHGRPAFHPRDCIHSPCDQALEKTRISVLYVRHAGTEAFISATSRWPLNAAWIL